MSVTEMLIPSSKACVLIFFTHGGIYFVVFVLLPLVNKWFLFVCCCCRSAYKCEWCEKVRQFVCVFVRVCVCMHVHMCVFIS